MDATAYTGDPLSVVEDNVPGGANGFAIKGGEGKFSLTNTSDGYHYAYEDGYVIRPDHTHSFTYSGSGTVITEECDCGHSATATISIQDGAKLTYTGSDIEPAEVTYSEDWKGGDLTPDYENNVNAGIAKATIKKDDAEANVTFTIEKANQTEPTASDYTIDYINEKITNIASGCKVYTAEDASTEVQSGELVTPGTTYYIRREGDANHHPSSFTSFTVAARPDAPSVIAVAETIKGKRDGKVTGVTTAMEYSTDNGQNWTPCTDTEITGLAAGTAVTVRVKATSTTPHGETESCTIPEGTTMLTVTFEENGGSAVADMAGLSYDVSISEPTAPEKTGYTFAGWYKELACTTEWNFGSDKVTGNITLYAKWTPAAYNITYHLDGGTVSDNPTSYNVETDSFTLNNPTRTGYTFVGWTGTGLPDASITVTIEKGSTGDRTYTAHWTANTYKVTLNANGGTLSDPVTSYTYGTAVSLPTPAKTGYTFAGWYENAELNGDAVTEITATDTGDKTFYAKWTLEAPVVELTANKTNVTYGETITLTAKATHAVDGLDYTYQWYRKDAALPDKTESTLTITDVADSDSYYVTVTASDNSLSSTVSSTPMEVKVKPLGIAVTWSGLTQVHGDKEPEVSAVLGGVLENDACTLSDITYQQGETTVTTPTDAGEYTAKVSLTGADAANYTLKNGTAALTIRPKTVGFTVSGNAVEGDDTAKTATVTPTDNALTQDGYTVTYRQGTATVAAPTAVGSYEIWVEITDGNYQHANGKAEMQVGTLTITQAPPVLYTVTFAGGEAAEAPEALSAVANAKIILPACTFEREHYLFTGWSYGGKTYQPGDSFTMPSGNVTFTAQWQQTYGITITVQEPKSESEEMQKVSDAVVSLWLGANKLDEQDADSDGKYTFANLLPGIYNLVVTKGDRTVTTMVEITTENVAKTADLPKGATNSIVKVAEGSPDIVVGNLEKMFTEEPTEAANGNYDAADAAVVESGGKVEITFIAEDKTEDVDEATQKEVDAIKEEAGASVTLGLVMDYSVQKDVYNSDGQRDNKKSTAITQTKTLLEIRLPLPAELWDMASYTVYRYHDTTAEKMTENPGANQEGFTMDAANHVITIYAQNFSTYAIGYTESSENNNDNNNNSSDNNNNHNQTSGGGGGSSAPAYSPSIVQPEHGTVTVSPKNPQKGDKVTITTTPEDGYTVDTVTVTDATGKIVEVTANDDGTYTFTQPSGKVTITVTFRQMTDASDCPRDESCPMADFSDTDLSAWYHDGVHYCLETGLMVGINEHTFAPHAATSRGMIVTILWRLEGSPIVGDATNYSDVVPGAWYEEAVRWADSVGVVTGYGNGTFGPNDPITREQMAVILWRYADSPDTDGSLSSFADGAQTSSWARSAMLWAVDQGLISGVSNGRLEPRGQATRAQAATILTRFAQNAAE